MTQEKGLEKLLEFAHDLRLDCFKDVKSYIHSTHNAMVHLTNETFRHDTPKRRLGIQINNRKQCIIRNKYHLNHSTLNAIVRYVKPLKNVPIDCINSQYMYQHMFKDVR